MGTLMAFVLGAALAVCALVLGSRRSLRIREALYRQIGSKPVGMQGGFLGDALDELKRDAPDLARAIEEPPKAEVEDQPAEFKPADAARIIDAPNDEAAINLVKEFVKDEVVQKIFVALARWEPRKPDLAENQFERSFLRSLKQQGFSEKVEDQRQISWSADFEHGGGTRRATPDMIVADRVLVELKASLEHSSDTDRTLGQMLRYLLAWKGRGPAVLTVCGNTAPEMKFLVRTHIKLWRDTLGLPVTVYFKRGAEYSDADTAFPQD